MKKKRRSLDNKKKRRVGVGIGEEVRERDNQGDDDVMHIVYVQ